MDGETAQEKETEHHEGGIKRMKEEKQRLKIDLFENERTYILKVEEK